jgi:TusA-related sulfurtransferase
MVERPADQFLDLRGSEGDCGDSALQLVRRALQSVAPGGRLQVTTNIAEHVFTVKAWARQTRRQIVGEETAGGVTTITVEQR